MAKNIVIAKKGVDTTFSSAQGITTRDAAYNPFDWIAEDDLKYAVLVVTENGHYKASADGYYGYSAVIVNVPIQYSMRGIDPEDGLEYIFTVDKSGNFTQTLVESEEE